MARYGHSMTYFPQKSILIIFGGRNDEDDENSTMPYLNDVWILTLEKLAWHKWDTKESLLLVPTPRSAHCATILGSSILIFGGLSNENYCKSMIHCLEMEYTGYKPGLEYPNPKYKKELQEDYEGDTKSKLKDNGTPIVELQEEEKNFTSVVTNENLKNLNENQTKVASTFLPEINKNQIDEINESKIADRNISIEKMPEGTIDQNTNIEHQIEKIAQNEENSIQEPKN